jgi:hypothetical protein
MAKPEQQQARQHPRREAAGSEPVPGSISFFPFPIDLARLQQDLRFS